MNEIKKRRAFEGKDKELKEIKIKYKNEIEIIVNI